MRYQDERFPGQDVDSYYDPRGRWVDTHILWDRAKLPAAFCRGVDRHFQGEAYEFYRIERPKGEAVYQWS